MPLADFMNFQLATRVQLEAVVGPIGNLGKSSFSEAVRNFHVDRLPKFASDVEGALCAYCGKVKDRRSLQIDHVIPIRTYLRGRFSTRGYQLDPTRIDNSRGKSIYNDTSNLVLACRKCNGKKTDRMPDVVTNFHWGASTAYNAAAGHFATMPAAFAVKINANRTLLESWNRMRSTTKRDFIFGRVVPRSHRMSTRHGGDDMSIAERVSRRPRKTVSASPYGRSRDDGLSNNEAIENVVTSLFAGGRPAINCAFSDLEPGQRHAHGAGTHKDRRICLYCLGTFNKQAFQIDHIRPVNRGFGGVKGSMTAAIYNDPQNLIPVCSNCNGSKNNGPLSRAFMDNAFQRRQNQGLPGIEDQLGYMQMSQVLLHRKTILGH